MPSRPDSSILMEARVAIVGGSSGVGLALAKRAAALGAQTILLARDARKLQAAAREIPRAQVGHLDLRRPETLAPALAALGSVAHLVVTAGTSIPRRSWLPRKMTGGRFWRCSSRHCVGGRQGDYPLETVARRHRRRVDLRLLYGIARPDLPLARDAMICRAASMT